MRRRWRNRWASCKREWEIHNLIHNNRKALLSTLIMDHHHRLRHLCLPLLLDRNLLVPGCRCEKGHNTIAVAAACNYPKLIMRITRLTVHRRTLIETRPGGRQLISRQSGMDISCLPSHHMFRRTVGDCRWCVHDRNVMIMHAVCM